MLHLKWDDIIERMEKNLLIATYNSSYHEFKSHKNNKKAPKLGLFWQSWYPVGESNPCYRRERAVS